MKKILHIVNSNRVIKNLKKAKVYGEFLAWNDLLYVGSLPKNLSLEELSKIRVDFLHKQGFGTVEEIRESFQKSNTLLKKNKKYVKIVFWFKDNLSDQLQLLQVLTWFAKHSLWGTTFSLISTTKHLEELSTKEIDELLHYEEILTPKHFKLAEKAWLAFCEPTPIKWFQLLKEQTSLLPFLKGTIKRVLEEYPNRQNGLSRTAYQALLIIKNGESEPKKIFIKNQQAEESGFMKDIVFWKILDDFIDYKLIASKQNGKELKITPLGKKVLRDERHWLEIKPIHHWIGGVEITSHNLWCWDIENKSIQKYYFSKVLSTILPIK